MAKIILLLMSAALLSPSARAEDWEVLADSASAANRPAQAEADIARALALRPDDPALLKKHAQLAAWAGDSAGAERSYRALVRLDPKDYDSLYLLANTISWQSRTREAIVVVNDYLVHRPEDAKALLFLGQLYQWDGDADASRAAMERYKALAGADKAYSAALVGQLAASGKERAAAAAATAALKKFPDDCDLYTGKAETESSLRWWGDMSDSLIHLSTACPDQAAVAGLSRRLNTPLRHSAHGAFSFATDSTGIQIVADGLDARYRINPVTYVSAGVESGWLQANAGSAFVTAGGNSSIDLYGGWIGAERMVGDGLWLSGRLGHRTSSEGNDAVLAKAGAEYRPADGLWLSDDFGSDLYAVSPRAVSLDIRMLDDTLHGSWRFSRRGTLYVDAGYGSLSDGNFLWTATAAPRWTILSGAKLSLDAGASAKVSSFNDPADGVAGGYYAPNRYRQFLANVLASYAFGPDDTISASANAGAVRDENQPRYGPSYDYSLEGSFGLYRDWLINPRLDFLDDLGAGAGAGANYHRQQYTLNLTRRF
jgi:Flp pilus assembly protein TadD